ncbi:MAG: diguanylate cyclase [Capsulimonadaceae bacterium]|nr:diguanylate cyclase [Capsulimonadaceae bacterium]
MHSLSDQQHKEAKVHRRGDLLALAFSGITDPVMVLDTDLRVIDCNDAVIECFADNPDRVIGSLWTSLFPQPEQDPRDQDLRMVLNEGIEWHARIPVIDVSTGDSLLFDVKSYPVRTGRRDTDPISHIVVCMHEVTDEVRTYLELVDRNRELQLIKEVLEEKAQKLDNEVRTLSNNNTELKAETSRLNEMALVDVMTGLPNFRAFNDRLHAEIKHAIITGRPLSLLLFDVDNFKQYNDQFGHPQGDDLLREMAMIARDSVRSTDFPARYGGEEFAVLLPKTDKFGAVVVAERLRLRIQDHPMPNRRTTISIGIAEFPSDTQGVDDLIQQADKAMYVAKSYGKNTSCLWSRDRHAQTRRLGAAPDTLKDADCVPVLGSNPSRPASTAQRILLVDKDELLLASLRDELQEYGISVSTAGSGRTALSKLAESAGAFDAMFTELVLTDRTGFELREQALALQPSLAIIFMSALEANVRTRNVFDEKIEHLTKPIHIADVLALLNRVHSASIYTPAAA